MFQPRPLVSGRCHGDVSVSPVITVVFSISATASATSRVRMTLQPGLRAWGQPAQDCKAGLEWEQWGTPQQKLKGGCWSRAEVSQSARPAVPPRALPGARRRGGPSEELGPSAGSWTCTRCCLHHPWPGPSPPRHRRGLAHRAGRVEGHRGGLTDHHDVELEALLHGLPAHLLQDGVDPHVAEVHGGLLIPRRGRRLEPSVSGGVGHVASAAGSCLGGCGERSRGVRGQLRCRPRTRILRWPPACASFLRWGN